MIKQNGPLVFINSFAISSTESADCYPRLYSGTFRIYWNTVIIEKTIKLRKLIEKHNWQAFPQSFRDKNITNGQNYGCIAIDLPLYGTSPKAIIQRIDDSNLNYFTDERSHSFKLADAIKTSQPVQTNTPSHPPHTLPLPGQTFISLAPFHLLYHPIFALFLLPACVVAVLARSVGEL